MTPAELLTDAFDRILKTATAAVHGLSEEQLVARPAAVAVLRMRSNASVRSSAGVMSVDGSPRL